MTVQHSGGLHAAWLLNMCLCVCCMCTRVYICTVRKCSLGEYQLVFEWRVCPSAWIVMMSALLFLYFYMTSWVCITGLTPLHIWKECTEANMSLQMKAKYLTANPLWLRERQGKREILSVHLFLCLSFWTALCQSSQIRFPILEFLDWFASNSHSCTGNLLQIKWGCISH